MLLSHEERRKRGVYFFSFIGSFFWQKFCGPQGRKLMVLKKTTSCKHLWPICGRCFFTLHVSSHNRLNGQGLNTDISDKGYMSGALFIPYDLKTERDSSDCLIVLVTQASNSRLNLARN